MDARSLNELLECSVCLEQLDATSRVLPCQHTFCRRCLDEIVATKSALCCPECRSSVEIPVRDLPTNILLVRLLEGIKNSKRGGGGCGASVAPLGNGCGDGAPIAAGCHVRAARASPKTILTSQPCAKALYNYDAKEPGDLSFKKNDMVLLRKQVDENWYHGELLDGHQGFFPATYVQVITPLPQDIPKCKALYDFLLSDNNEKDCLTFQRDETITVIRRVDNNWAEGKLADRIGIFPISFVEMNDSAKWLVNAHVTTNVQTSSANRATTTATTTATASVVTTSAATTSTTSGTTSHPAVTKRHSMTDSLSPTTTVVTAVTSQQRHSTELTGQNVMSNASGRTDTSSVVTAVVSSTSSVMAAPRSTAQVVGAMSDVTTSSTQSPHRMPAPTSIYVALYSYKPQKADEVALVKGDYYTIVDRCHDGWYKGTCLRTAAVGVFPGNYVQPVKINGTGKLPVDTRGNTNGLTTIPSSTTATTSTNPSTTTAIPSPSCRHPTTAGSHTSTVTAARSRPITSSTTSGQATELSRAHSFPRSSPNLDATPRNRRGRKVAACQQRSVRSRGGPEGDERKCEPEISTVVATGCSGVGVGSAPIAAGVGGSSVGASRDKPQKDRREKDALRVGLMKRLSIAGKGRKSRSATVVVGSGSTAETPEGSTGSSSSATPAATTLTAANTHQRTSSMPNATPSQQPVTDASGGGSTGTQPSGACGSSTTQQSKPSKTKPLVRERYRCIMPYPPHSDIELELKVGDVVFVHKRREDGWFKGMLQRTGKTGLFPGSFVKNF